MSETEALRAFAVSLLEDVGAEVRGDGTFLWATLPESIQAGLDLPAQACLTLDADRVGEFDAELVAPGSYLLEKLLELATRRGRWDVARMTFPSSDWIEETLGTIPNLPSMDPSPDAAVPTEQLLLIFAFRTALTSDEKREGLHLIAAVPDGSDAWLVPWPLPEAGLAPAVLPGLAPDTEAAYRRARAVLEHALRDETESFRKASLTALEEEVRRIFRYFDGTVAEVREAAPSGAEDVVRAIGAERDRRLAEAVERFEPHAVASLCSLRILLVPVASMRVTTEAGSFEVSIDALTRHVRGLPAGLTGAGSAPLRERPPSGTPPRRTKAGRGPRRSPRGSRERSRSAASRRRGS